MVHSLVVLVVDYTNRIIHQNFVFSASWGERHTRGDDHLDLTTIRFSLIGIAEVFFRQSSSPFLRILTLKGDYRAFRPHIKSSSLNP